MDAGLLKEDTRLTVKPKGRLDTATTPELEAQIRPELSGVTDLVLDLEGADYVSSAGLRLFLALHQEMEARNGSFALRNVNDFVMEVIDMTGFRDIMTIE